MPNKNYIKGRRKEYKIVKEFKLKGYDIVQRSAGSHSPIDVIAIDKKTHKIKLIQCKPNNYSINKTNQLINDNIELNGIFNVEFIVI